MFFMKDLELAFLFFSSLVMRGVTFLPALLAARVSCLFLRLASF